MVIDDQAGLQESIISVLKTVYDPEIPVNIYDLGLVYELRTNPEGEVFLMVTLTAPGCPVGADIVSEIDEKVRQIEGVRDVHVELTFDPPWNMGMMSDEAKLELGFM
ncbi:FeS assembly SUF system protein [Thermoflavifilum aggregans]|uniref:FeS assembly SUF system protein n=1 Tax=Thermoflavifilum aggregans TaxID=454188 RepID=A0A2M9CUG1_9BACT|nr:iron-sulfur cluster assembly protein [Thermoflavifilum aggregans]PJJ75485.1 FeS assembly SUF system protein [Thermoflavifilum aggregans]